MEVDFCKEQLITINNKILLLKDGASIVSYIYHTKAR